MPQCQFLFSEKLYRKYSRNCTGQKPSVLEFRYEAIAIRGHEGWAQGGQTTPRRGPRSGRAGGVSRPPWPPPTPPLRLFISVSGKPWIPERKSTKSSAAAVIDEPISGGFWSSSGTLPEGEITAGCLLHHHACLRDDV